MYRGESIKWRASDPSGERGGNVVSRLSERGDEREAQWQNRGDWCTGGGLVERQRADMSGDNGETEAQWWNRGDQTCGRDLTVLCLMARDTGVVQASQPMRQKNKEERPTIRALINTTQSKTKTIDRKRHHELVVDSKVDRPNTKNQALIPC
ncbi:hypothetical protein Syun_014830 [Stephania yunnanensis]|uniref:Uncharacterized protein n=1 Tax=Stephania yunnanensis TaxID=152371 RepID=A0AAP0JKX9_9MAGN